MSAFIDDSAHARRRAPRRSMYLWGTVRPLGRGTERLLVRNLSKSGFMGETSGTYAPGGFIEVMLPGMGRLKACVAWSERGKVGARFLGHGAGLNFKI